MLIYIQHYSQKTKVKSLIFYHMKIPKIIVLILVLITVQINLLPQLSQLHRTVAVGSHVFIDTCPHMPEWQQIILQVLLGAVEQDIDNNDTQHQKLQRLTFIITGGC